MENKTENKIFEWKVNEAGVSLEKHIESGSDVAIPSALESSPCDMDEVFHKPADSMEQMAESLLHVDLDRFRGRNKKKIVLEYLKNMERDLPEVVWEVVSKRIKDFVIEFIRTEHVPALTRLLALKKPTAMQLDAYMTEAKDVNHPEINALLLEYSKGISETEREKVIERKLNANPFAVEQMKKLWNYKTGVDGHLTITGYKGTDTDIEIPPMIGKKIVTRIGNHAFVGQRSLTSVVLPESVREIEQSAFFGCDALQSIGIPDKVTGIGIRAFFACGALASIELPASVTEIGVNAFSGYTVVTRK